MKINTNNTEKLNAAIDAAQKGCRARTIDVETIQAEVRRIDRELPRYLPKSAWKGIAFEIDFHAQAFPSSYNGIPESTQFTMVRGANAWFVRCVFRHRTSRNRNNEMILTDEHRAAMCAHIERNF